MGWEGGGEGRRTGGKREAKHGRESAKAYEYTGERARAFTCTRRDTRTQRRAQIPNFSRHSAQLCHPHVSCSLETPKFRTNSSREGKPSLIKPVNFLGKKRTAGRGRNLQEIGLLVSGIAGSTARSFAPLFAPPSPPNVSFPPSSFSVPRLLLINNGTLIPCASSNTSPIYRSIGHRTLSIRFRDGNYRVVPGSLQFFSQ